MIPVHSQETLKYFFYDHLFFQIKQRIKKFYFSPVPLVIKAILSHVPCETQRLTCHRI